MMLNYSIIIPHYNSPSSLERLLSSIPPRQDLEVFVVDDHSSKKPNGVCARFRSRFNITLLENKYLKGAGGARNTALDEISGKFVIFADADDIFTDNAFSIFDDYLESQHEIVFFAPEGIKDDGSATQRHLSYVNLVHRYIRNNDQAIRYKFHVPWSKLISASLIKDNHIKFEETLVANDTIFSLLVGSKASKVAADNQPVYCVYESANSLTKLANFSSLEQRYDVINRYNKWLKLNVEKPSAYYTSLIPIVIRMAKVDAVRASKLFIRGIFKETASFAWVSIIRNLWVKF